MPKKRDARRDTGSAKPKELRKRLRKAEEQLQDAQTRRDRAQARVDALSIIADEIRAQLADLERASTKAATEPADDAETTPAGRPADDAETTPAGRPADGDGVTPAPEAAPDPDGGSASATPNRPRRPRKTQPAV
jgi:hypothetical protein